MIPSQPDTESRTHKNIIIQICDEESLAEEKASLTLVLKKNGYYNTTTVTDDAQQTTA